MCRLKGGNSLSACSALSLQKTWWETHWSSSTGFNVQSTRCDSTGVTGKITVLLPFGMPASALPQKGMFPRVCHGGGKGMSVLWVQEAVWERSLLLDLHTALSLLLSSKNWDCLFYLSKILIYFHLAIIWVRGNVCKQPLLMRYRSANLQKQARNSSWGRNLLRRLSGSS